MRPAPGDDPYAPPRADPTTAPAVVNDSGSLWRVVDGRLQFREMASLPDVCISGSPPGEPGTRTSLALESQALMGWVRGVALLLLAIIGLAGVIPWPKAKTLLFFAAFLLPGLLAKKPRILVFRSKRKESAVYGRSLLIGLGFLLLVHLLRMFWERPSPEDFLLHVALVMGIVQVVLLLSGKLPHVRPLGDGWFEWRKLPPAAIHRLKEIQQRTPPYMERLP